ncbi:MAG: hypothetical protein DBX40_02355 [Clostridiales bacterium]|nr:MAG: hypothetical protein DBX40_02315 [Clostridiales bacterium]PWM27376.1 MAG: hypothetical protein DBX40_02335 [Clostridiales bacterium]PWM27380.1 MAG: hypothetical protein DBX40_02355 [Clostridiales bacterium]
MARPKLPNFEKKVKINLTVSPETKEMAEAIRIKKNVSISTLVEEMIRKEYKKLVKSGEAKELPMPGQVTIDDYTKE